LRAAAIAAVAAAVAFPVLARGGYTSASRSIFVILAGVALGLAVGWRRPARASLVRDAPVAALLGLALMAALSALWTVAEPEAALRWSLVIAAYAGVCLCGALIGAEPTGARAIAAIVAAVAAVSGAAGLVGVTIQETPYAERIGGSWQPGGTFEYAPALALLQVSALPGLVFAICRCSRPVAVAAAFGAAIAGAQIALSDSLTEQLLGAAVLASALFLPGRLLGRDRLAVALAIAVPVVAGAAAHLTLGGYARPIVNPDDGERLLLGAGCVAAPAALWALFAARALPRAAGISAGARRSVGVALAAIVAAVVIAGIALADDAGRFKIRGVPGETTGGGGRVELWDDAVAVALERPLLGSGAEAFLAASLEEQGAGAVRFAHSLPLETGAELGAVGLLLVMLLYATSALAIWRARGSEAAWLLAPAVAAFLIANLVDWSWHLAGAGAIWALCLGGMIAAQDSPATRSAIRQPRDD